MIFLKSLKNGNDYYKKKYNPLSKKKKVMNISKNLIGTVELRCGTGVTASGLALLGIMCASSFSF